MNELSIIVPCLASIEGLPQFIDELAEYLMENPADVESALEEAFAQKEQTVFMDFITDQSENVYPMIAAGGGHNEMHLKPSEVDDAPLERELA